MSHIKVHDVDMGKKLQPAHRAEEATRQPEQGPVQQVAPQTAYRPYHGRWSSPPRRPM